MQGPPNVLNNLKKAILCVYIYICLIYIYMYIYIYRDMCIYKYIIHIYHPKQMKHMPETWQIFPFPGSDRLPPLATPASHVLAHRSASPLASESEFVAVAGEMWWKILGNLNHLGLWSLKMDRNGSPCWFSSWEFYIFLWPIFIKHRDGDVKIPSMGKVVD